MSDPTDSDHGPTPEASAEDAELTGRVEKALALTRSFLTPEELDEHRRMLLSLARVHGKHSTWLSDQRPREVPDSSGFVQKKDDAALSASIARRAGGRGRGA
jgi:hypothetical protein